ncbi:hypothetical protein DFH07DRAFT_59209 [Mycena maculata]|uniref:F-box domain-containing protein n=1 Tax=Mycena maculata TaxID=230809 RepID=A0AAD7IEB6_9AGAR|nr:hypothetical protein DFH07DRAFT_59209 [Mycena maculata]
MPRVPAELVDLIISFLHPHPLRCGNGIGNFLDKAVARNVGLCGLVCRAWAPSSRRVLFYRVHVRQYTAHAFAKLFRKPQHLTFLPFIRELEFRNGIAENSWMNTVLPKITKHLHPSTLVLSAGSAHFDTLPRLHLRTITRLEIVNFPLDSTDAIEFIASFPALEGLKVWLENEWRSTELPQATLRPAESLRCLDLKSTEMGSFLGWFQGCRAAISTLRLCHPSSMRTTPESFRSTAEYIESLGPSLTSLTIKVDFEGPQIQISWRQYLTAS